MFHWLQPRISKAFASPVELRKNLQRWSARADLCPIPRTEFIAQLGGWRDLLAEYSPTEEWALVCFDHASVLLLERNRPPHAKLIAQSEILLLRPHLPPKSFPERRKREGAEVADEEKDARFLAELEHCRRTQPRHTWCRAAEAAWVRTRHGDDARAVGVALLRMHEIKMADVLAHQVDWLQEESVKLLKLEKQQLAADAAWP
mmetsp:Transcript_18688/g.43592  ORF Transcript_18688/g.43592 Transcript_18688/m.43592 type:complete len:203 (+) Transcript_18688:2181-2789(+)